jgi:hypothetical protein
VGGGSTRLSRTTRKPILDARDHRQATGRAQAALRLPAVGDLRDRTARLYTRGPDTTDLAGTGRTDETDLEANLVGLDERIARAEKKWSETPKLTLKRPLKLAGSGLVLPAGTEFVRTDEMLRYPGLPEFRILMIRGTPYHATDAAIDEALKD